MIATAALGVRAARVALVSDAGYYATVRRLAEQATNSCFASIFIVDLNAHDDPDARVLQVLRGLQAATWKGVEVKLLVGGSTQNLAINEACHIARHMAAALGIECRLLARDGRPGSHMKFVTADDFVLSGSHNWSLGSLSGQIQDSLLMKSPQLAAYLRGVFQSQWARAL